MLKIEKISLKIPKKVLMPYIEEGEKSKAKRKRAPGQTVINKILHKTLKLQKHEPH
jgi:hypothetical protein